MPSNLDVSDIWQVCSNASEQASDVGAGLLPQHHMCRRCHLQGKEEPEIMGQSAEPGFPHAAYAALK